MFFKYSFFFFFHILLVVLSCTWHIFTIFHQFFFIISLLPFYYQPLCLDCSLLTLGLVGTLMYLAYLHHFYLSFLRCFFVILLLLAFMLRLQPANMPLYGPFDCLISTMNRRNIARLSSGSQFPITLVCSAPCALLTSPA